MRDKNIAGITLVLLLMLLGFHIYAMKHYWYIKYNFVDIPMHFLGGVCLALSVLYITKKTRYVVPFTLILGIFWEIFEVRYNLTGWPFGTTGYKLDTAGDIFMDILGGVFVWLVYRYNKIKNERISNIS